MDLLINYSRTGTATSFHRGLIGTGVSESCGMYWSDEFRWLCKGPAWLGQVCGDRVENHCGG